MATHNDTLVVGLVSVSDRASKGEYRDEGIPALKAWLGQAIAVITSYSIHYTKLYESQSGFRAVRAPASSCCPTR